MRFTIGAKLMGLVAVLLLCSEIMLAGLSTRLLIDDNTALIQQMNAEAALSLSTQMRAHFDGFTDRMRLLGEVWVREVGQAASARSAAAAKLPSVVRDFFARDPEFVALQLYSSLGGKKALLSEYHSKESSLALSSNPFVSAWVEGNEGIMVSPVTLGSSVGLRVGIPVDRGRHLLVGWISLTRFTRTFQERQGAHSMLLDPDGNLLIGTESAKRANPWGAVKKLLGANLSNGQTRYEEASGERHLVAFRTVGVGGLTVVTQVAESKALEIVRRLQFRAMMLAVVVLFVSFIAGYFYSETITSPIRDLVVAAETIAMGNYRVRLEPNSNDELADLSHAFNDMVVKLEERVRVMDTLNRFHGKEIAEQLLSSKARLGGERRAASVLFVDIRDFTAMTEKMSPEKVVELVNEYLTRMVGVIGTYGGKVDKYIGDAIMALWGVPKIQVDDTTRAVRCCLEMREELERLNKLRVSRMQAPLRIGMGLNFGNVVAGNIGSAKMMQYTVLGDPVNVASRIQSATKIYRTDLLVSRSVFDEVGDRFLFEPCRMVKVKGKSEELEVFRVLGYIDNAGRPIRVPEPESLKAAS